MLKLSQISKVVLTTGLVLAFSCGTVTVSWAEDTDCQTTASNTQKTCKATASSTKDDCDAACDQETDKSTKKTCKSKCKTTYSNTVTECETTYKSAVAKCTSDDYAKEEAAWKEAKAAKDEADAAYTTASEAYNKCLATSSAADCTDKLKAMNDAKAAKDEATTAYNAAQKTTTNAYYANQVATEKSDSATAKAQSTAQKAYDSAKSTLSKCQSAQSTYASADSTYTSCLDENNMDESKCKSEKKAFDKAKKAAEKYSDTKCSTEEAAVKTTADELSQYTTVDDSGTAEDDSDDSDTASQGTVTANDVSALKNAYESAQAAYDAAEAECQKYSAMTSSDAQAKAQTSCANAVKLEQAANEAKAKYDAAKTAYEKDNDTTPYNKWNLKNATAKGDYGVLDASASDRKDLFGGDYKSNYFDYTSGGDVFEKITRRAALIIVSLKPIVFVFAGFGLIAFAWMAIFNKLSWKWFANLAMGLFLVGNMGRLIEYFVGEDGTSTGAYNEGAYYIGAWSDSAKKGNSNSRLANAFYDTYYVYGDVWVASTSTANEGSTSTEDATFTASTRSFCQSTSGSGWANFSSCLSDIVSSVKKTADTVKTVSATVSTVVNEAKTVASAVSSAASAAADILSAGSLSDIVDDISTISGNVNTAIQATNGAVVTLNNGTTTVANDIQDIGKSTEEQAELSARRNDGEATNSVAATVSGQEWDSVNQGVEKVDSEYASKDSSISNLTEAVADAASKSGSTDSKLQSGLDNAGYLAGKVDSVLGLESNQ
jgi:hypothetical protein